MRNLPLGESLTLGPVAAGLRKQHLSDRMILTFYRSKDKSLILNKILVVEAGGVEPRRPVP